MASNLLSSIRKECLSFDNKNNDVFEKSNFENISTNHLLGELYG